MQRLTGIEIAALIFAACLCIGGTALIIRPNVRVVLHFTNGWNGSNPTYAHHETSPRETRIYGGVALLLGLGLGAGALYRSR